MNFIVSFARRNKLFLISLLIITLTSAQAQLGFLMVMAAPVAVISQLIKLVVRRKDPIQRNDRFVALAVIALSLLVVSLSHMYLYKAARSVADTYVAEIASFKKANSRYPANGKELGLSDNLRERPYSLTYYNKDEKPRLYYVATFGPFDKYVYNFSDGVWDYQAD